MVIASHLLVWKYQNEDMTKTTVQQVKEAAGKNPTLTDYGIAQPQPHEQGGLGQNRQPSSQAHSMKIGLGDRLRTILFHPILH